MACGTLTGEQRRANERRLLFFPPRRYRRSSKSKKGTRVREFFGMGIITPGSSRCNKLSGPRALTSALLETVESTVDAGRLLRLFIFTGPGPLGKPVICSFNPAVARCVRSFQLETAFCSTSLEHTSKFLQSLSYSSCFCSVDVITGSLLCIRSLFSRLESFAVPRNARGRSCRFLFTDLVRLNVVYLILKSYHCCVTTVIIYINLHLYQISSSCISPRDKVDQ